ncbi:MAG: alginate lyase family protein, partial [Verrucomicrobiota bacterium]|nr:alginate lyase family protein [Verrucomicrobiota bacterium]
FYHIASGILKSELEEQILSDGGHFELSPMYHQIILYRVLDCYNLVKNNSWQECELLSILKEKAGLMLGWLEQVTFSNGDIPLVNDAIVGIAPTSKQLCNYAGRLNLKSKKTKLKECGYRKICSSNYELFCDVGKVGPDYIPGHAHADTLSFLLYVTGKPLIVDPGISTYEKNDCRQKERSTESHNTIVINDTNSSDVWGGFRVANRAKIVDIEEGEGFIRATHEGYKKIGALHKRIFEYNESGLEIYDEISSKNSIKCKAFFHFAPGVEPEIDDGVISLPKAIMSFVGSEKIELFDYDFSDGFNKLTPAKAVRVYFNKELKSTVLIAYGTDGKTRKTDKKYIKSFAQ